MTSDQFALPSIAYWTSEPSFIGGEDAVKPTHDHVAHIAELSKLLIALRAGAFKPYASELAAQKTAMRKTIDAINAYYEVCRARVLPCHQAQALRQISNVLDVNWAFDSRASMQSRHTHPQSP